MICGSGCVTGDGLPLWGYRVVSMMEFGSRMETDTGDKIMAKLGLIALLVATASVAQATADVQLDIAASPSSLLATSGSAPGFTGGENLTIEVRVSEPAAASSFVRFAQLDFANTDAALNVSNFQWDFSETASGTAGTSWITSNSTPLPQAAFMPLVEDSSVQWQIPAPAAGQSGVLLATFDVQLPVAQGSYDLDVLLAGDPNNSAVGGVLTTGFTSADLLTRTIGSGGLTGGALTFVVVPEPATLLLFGLAGTVTAIRRRRRRS